MNKPITGTTAECVKHFARTTGLEEVHTSRKAWESRAALAELLKLHTRTLHAWFSKGIMPKGITLAQLHCMLEYFGYTITERENMPNEQRIFNECVALSVFSPEEAMSELQIKHSTLWAWCQGKAVPKSEGLNRLRRFVERHDAERMKYRESWLVVFRRLGFMPNQATSAGTNTRSHPVLPGTPVESASALLDHKAIVAMTANLILALHPLVSTVLSDDFTPEQRAELRQRTQHGRDSKLFELSNNLNRLCSERARTDIPRH